MISTDAMIQAWHHNKATGKRYFHDHYPQLISLMQKVFANWAESPVPHTPWFEINNIQVPPDYMNYLEVILRTGPRVVIECGSNSGGSAAVWAEMLRRIVGTEFKVITIEIKAAALNKKWIKSDPNIISLIGDTTSAEIFNQVKTLIPKGAPTLITLDSEHTAPHVMKEIGLYGPLVTSGSYMIVQDTFLGLAWGGNLQNAEARAAIERGDTRAFDYIDWPLGAVEALMDTNEDFVWDLDRQRYVTTLHPFGWLHRK